MLEETVTYTYPPHMSQRKRHIIYMLYYMPLFIITYIFLLPSLPSSDYSVSHFPASQETGMRACRAALPLPKQKQAGRHTHNAILEEGA